MSAPETIGELVSALGFEKEEALRADGKCPRCALPTCHAEFRDMLSERESGITGLCQPCQDLVFKEDEDDALEPDEVIPPPPGPRLALIPSTAQGRVVVSSTSDRFPIGTQLMVERPAIDVKPEPEFPDLKRFLEESDVGEQMVVLARGKP